ncbi:uncharacterized protein LOC116585644 isoform X3 [Mustela erminea]|uniref:uncharacterized protein LOC116585644 isoform X3 n=1 Tax=Mustela erminea TaxID=36723 RepID=UPI00138700FF|nr:uncharacterized protein LOC116585644 isoform X3 [Mustela erminea]
MRDIFGQRPVKGVSCSYYERTSIQKKHTCSIRVSPLCASNNVTYSNTCVYCFANICMKTHAFQPKTKAASPSTESEGWVLPRG